MGNNTGLAGWAYWALSLVSHLPSLRLQRKPNLCTHHLGWPSCVVSALSFYWHYHLSNHFVLSTPHLRYLVRYTSAFFLPYLLCVLALLACSRVFSFMYAVGEVSLVLRYRRCKTRKIDCIYKGNTRRVYRLPVSQHNINHHNSAR